MIIQNKGYAAYLTIIKGKSYYLTDKRDLEFDLTLPEHDILYAEYKASPHRKIHKLFMKFYSLSKPT
jgi:hypothetical protein